MKSNIQGYWLGHSAFKFVTPSGKVIYVDPFLTHNPSTPEEHKTVEKADFILLTHGHEDHVGDTIEIAANTGAKVVSIVELSRLLVNKYDLGQDQALEFNKGGSIHFDEFSVTMVSANHSSSYNGDYAGEAAGLILSFEDDVCVYHMGDTNIFADLTLYGELYEPHLVLAPIGDHYTMGPEEAAYAVEMLDADVAIPIHYDTFPPIEADPDEFREKLEEISETEVYVPEIGTNFMANLAFG